MNKKEIILIDEQKAYKKAKLYKSILFKKTKFKTDIEDVDFQNYVNALNIKNRRKRIVFIYDYCCQKLDKFYEGKNICEFKDGKCLNQQYPKCKYINGCCRLCPYQTDKGCSTSNLSCKLFYCYNVTEKHEILEMKDLKILKLFSIRQRLMLKDSFFSTREQILFDLFWGSLIIYAARMYIRLFEGLIKLFKMKRKNKTTKYI